MKCLVHEDVWQGDPWRVLATCIMYSCTTEEKARPIIVEFFKRWPAAKSCYLGNIEEQVKLLAPLGFYGQKADRIKKLSKLWVTFKSVSSGDPENFNLSAAPGCGQYARDAYDLVVLKRYDRPFKNKELERRRLELFRG